MVFDPHTALKRKNWQLNKNSQLPAHRVPPSLLARAQAEHANGNYPVSLELLEQDPDWDQDNRGNRLASLCHFGNTQGVLDPESKAGLFKKAYGASDGDIELSGREYAKALVNRAAILCADNRYKEAHDFAQRALTIDPLEPTVHVAMLSIYNRQKFHDETISYIRFMVTTYPAVLRNAVFQWHLVNDIDLTGVAELVANISGEAA